MLDLILVGIAILAGLIISIIETINYKKSIKKNFMFLENLIKEEKKND